MGMLWIIADKLQGKYLVCTGYQICMDRGRRQEVGNNFVNWEHENQFHSTFFFNTEHLFNRVILLLVTTEEWGKRGIMLKLLICF